jgi:cytochrome b
LTALSRNNGAATPSVLPQQPVWTWPVRLLHWSLVASVTGAWFTREGMAMLHEVHIWLGYCALGIASARVALGFWSGNRYTRFAQFVQGRRPTLGYARAVLRHQAPRYLGHNPLGGWMVLALLGCVGALGFTGWLYTTDMFWGYGWLADLHMYLGWTLLALVALHVGGVLFTSWQHKENLVAAMASGRKPGAQAGDVD